MTFYAIILFLAFSPAPLGKPFSQAGNASFYADAFQGHKTANGEKYDRQKLTAAHATLPFNTLVRVTNSRNGKSTTVRINDRMKASRHKIIDLSREAATRLGLVREGIGPVRLEEVEEQEEEENTPPKPVLPLERVETLP